MIDRPDVLVLGAGGALGERWMQGVLAGISAAGGVDFRSVESFVGTSAGAVVAAELLAGRAPGGPGIGSRAAETTSRAADAHARDGRTADRRRASGPARPASADDPSEHDDPREHDDPSEHDDPREHDDPSEHDDPREHDEPSEPTTLGARARRLGGAAGGALATRAERLARGVGGAAAGPLAPRAMRIAEPAGALLRASVLGRIPPSRGSLDELGRRIAREGLRFDGRLRVVCVERESGRRVVFGAPGAPTATVAEAIQASCSVPWLYGPVEIDGRGYVDGGLWSPTSIDVAPAGRDTHVLALNPTAGDAAPAPAAGAIRTLSRSAAGLEAMLVRRRGAQVQLIAPDRAAAALLAGPSGDDLADDALAAGYRQGVELARVACRKNRAP